MLTLSGSAPAIRPGTPGDDAPAFFRHHGFMAPGIRAFRRIGFPAKSAWVSLAFLLPIVLLSASLWLTASQSIAFSSKEGLQKPGASPNSLTARRERGCGP